MMQPVNVIILNWNGGNLLREYLPEVIAATNPALARITVADNGSTDDSPALLAKEFPQVSVIPLGKNYGFAEGYNRAIESITDKYTVLLNSDVAPAPGWIDTLYSFMERTPDAAAVMPKVLSRREPEKFEHAGAAGGLIDRHGFPYCYGRIMSKVEKDSGQYDGEPREIFWASGAAFMTRTDIYKECGGLDNSFFAHMEEIDLCWRMQLAGYRIYCDPAAKVYHLGGASLPYSNPRKTYLNFRNNLLMIAKNIPRRDRTRTLLVRRLIDTLAWCKFAATLDFRNAAAVFRAHRDFAAMQDSYPSPEGIPNLLKGKRDIIFGRKFL